MASEGSTSSTPLMEDENTPTLPQNPSITNPPPLSPAAASNPSSISSTHPSLPNFNQPISAKLDDSNYLVWRMQMQNIIIANGLEGYIDGSSLCLSQFVGPDSSPNPAFQAWHRCNRLLMSHGSMLLCLIPCWGKSLTSPQPLKSGYHSNVRTPLPLLPAALIFELLCNP